MAFPTSPTDGQIYQGYIYNGTIGAWKRDVLGQDSIFPIGFIYVQFPNKPTPEEMNWPGNWDDVSTSEYSGAFFRAAGSTPYGSASTFESGAQEDQMQGHIHTSSGYIVIRSSPYTESYSLDNDRLSRKSLQDITNGYTSDGTNGNPRIGPETRPYNFTVRIWKRIS